MTVQTRSPLEQVMLRAGASDKDRAAWLAQRASGVTATNIRDLMTGAITRRQLVDEKLNGSSFGGNAYTRWGNEREPVIAAVIADRFNIAPESRVFRAADNERFLCSPDGLGESWEGEGLGSEVKTSGEDVAPDTAAFEKKGYLWQVLWNMRVTGFSRWLYAWEFRLGTPQSGFEAGLLSFEWIEYDTPGHAEKVALMEAEALAFLVELDAAIAAGGLSTPDVDDVVDTHAVNYLRFIAEENEAGTAKKAEYDAILELVGEREEFTQEGATARVTLTPMKHGTRQEIDLEAAKAAEPDLFASLEVAQAKWDAHVAGFSREVPTETKPRLTITAKKETKK